MCQVIRRGFSRDGISISCRLKGKMFTIPVQAPVVVVVKEMDFFGGRGADIRVLSEVMKQGGGAGFGCTNNQEVGRSAPVGGRTSVAIDQFVLEYPDIVF